MIKVKPLILLGTAFIISACQNGESVKQDCSIDPALIHSWSEFGSLPERETPFAEVYQQCGKTLVYVAAKHSNDPESATHKLVHAAFDEYDIKFAIVEGFPSAMGVSPEKLITYTKGTKGTPRDAEPYVTIRRASESGIGFQGGEPTDKQIMETVAKQGLNSVDLLGYYIVRQIPQWIRREEITDVTDPRMEALIFNLVGSFSTDTELTMETFKAVDGLEPFREWYQKTNGITLNAEFREQDAWPSSAIPDPRKTNEYSDKVADTRDTHIVSIINRALAAHDTVLVVYGASHHDIQAPALKAALGEPKTRGSETVIP